MINRNVNSISGSHPIAEQLPVRSQMRAQRVDEKTVGHLPIRFDKVTISKEARNIASINNRTGKNGVQKTEEKVVYDYTQWPLAVHMAESFKPEILKMTSIASERDREIDRISAREKTDSESKVVQRVKETTASGKTRKTGNPAYDYVERAIDAYKRQPQPERGRNINTSLLLWYEIALSFLGAFVYALYLDFDFIESILLALLGSALGIYFHEMHHFVTARRLILEKKLHTYLPHGVGLFHRELIRAMKGEPSNSYITVNIDKRGIKVVYPREILFEEENLKADRSGSRANVRVLISFGILGIFFYLLFSVIAFASFIQWGFSAFREGMKKK